VIHECFTNRTCSYQVLRTVGRELLAHIQGVAGRLLDVRSIACNPGADSPVDTHFLLSLAGRVQYDLTYAEQGRSPSVRCSGCRAPDEAEWRSRDS